jgi:hypothetical protein
MKARHPKEIVTKRCKECSGPLKTWDQIYCGYRCSSIARELYRKGHGLYRKKFSDALVRKAVKLVNAGAYWKVAASSIGMSHDAFRKRAREMKCRIRFRKGKLKAIAPMRMKLPATESTLGYLAGILDGEGTITLHRGARKQVFITISNTDTKLMSWLKTIGGSVQNRKISKLGTKVCFVWKVVGRADVEAFLRAVYPYMRIKKDKALLAIRTLVSYRKQREWEYSGHIAAKAA